MYSIRPHSSDKLDLNLPTNMYVVRPIIESIPTETETNSSTIDEISREQDRLLVKINEMISQLEFIDEQKNPRDEEFVLHLSVKKPSEKLFKFLVDHREEFSIRIFRHSSAVSSILPSVNLSTGGKAQSRPLVLIWSEKDKVPSMRHGQMSINDEEQIVNLLNDELKKKNKN